MIANECGGSHNAIDKGGRFWRDSFLQVQEDQLRMKNDKQMRNVSPLRLLQSVGRGLSTTRK